MSAPNEFDREIKALTSSLVEDVDAAVRKTALAIDQAVVLATPVDEGRARSNWVVGLDSAPSGTIDPYAPGKGLGSSESGNANAAMAQGRSVIAGYKGGRNSSIHITNNLPYIERLNDGWSAQAPAGFVEQAVVAGDQALTRAKILDK